MNLKTAEFIVDQVENIGEEAELYEDYSGRSMYGKTTSGVVVSHGIHILRAIASFTIGCDGRKLTEDEYEILEEISNGLKQDSMANDVIIY